MTAHVQLALFGGPKALRGPLPRWPRPSARGQERLLESYLSGRIGGYPSPGPFAERFAAEFARRHDAAFGICAANGSVTLDAALAALEVGRGDEVVVPAYTWIATATCAVNVGATPVFVDVDPETYCIDVRAAEAAITARTRAVVAVHLGSAIADLDALLSLCERRDLDLVEDCAHAHGARWRGLGVGSFGAFGSFSFQSGKLLTAGEGGLLTTNDPLLRDRALALVDCGRWPAAAASPAGPEPVLGHNRRLTELQAAVLLAHVEALDEQAAARRRHASILERVAREVGLRPQAHGASGGERVGFALLLRRDEAVWAGVSKARLLEALRAEGVPAQAGYDPVPLSPLFGPVVYGGEEGVARLRGRFPVAERARADEAIWLPHELFLEEDAVRGAADALAKVHAAREALRS